MMIKKKIYKENNNSSQKFLIISFFTKNLESKAKRLSDSLEKLDLNYKIFEIPEIHFSKSMKGTSNLNYCQPKLILDALDEYQMPVLYVDSDIVFVKYPKKIFDLDDQKIDFAIYNWFEDFENDGYKPIQLKIDNQNEDLITTKRFYVYSHSMDFINQKENQLYSSGAVSYLSNSSNSLKFLNKWFDNISLYPKCVDDQTLNYTFNFTYKDKENLKTSWLDKSYCRYNFWIFTDPVIDHPDTVTEERKDFQSITNKLTFDKNKLKIRNSKKFADDSILDTKNKRLYKPLNGELIFIKEINDDLFN